MVEDYRHLEIQLVTAQAAGTEYTNKKWINMDAAKGQQDLWKSTWGS